MILGNAFQSVFFWAEAFSWIAAVKVKSVLSTIYVFFQSVIHLGSSSSSTAGQVGMSFVRDSVPWDLRLMAFLPPSLFMSRRELWLYRFVPTLPRACIIFGDALLSSFTIVHQIGVTLKSGSNAKGGAKWQSIVMASIPIIGSISIGYGLISAGMKPALGYYLRLAYNVLLILFNVFFVVMETRSKNAVIDKKSSSVPVIKAYKHGKWSLAVLYPLVAVIMLIAVEYLITSAL